MEEIIITDEDIQVLREELGYPYVIDDIRAAILKDNSSIDVHACPGSGKTSLIALKLLLLAKKWNSPYQGVCVLTHTNVARDEILNRIEQHPHGNILKHYPHFIGTIQEFVDRFFAIPFIKSDKFGPITIDSELCENILWSWIRRGTKTYLHNRHIDSFGSFILKNNDGTMEFLVPGFNAPSASDSYRDLESAKNRLLEEGYYYYREMYEYATCLLLHNPTMCSIIRMRFPFIIIDEMQDTQMHQDDFLTSIFSNRFTILQRFGDPNQSIYDGMGDRPNISFNNGRADYAILDSHRFGEDIVALIQSLRFNMNGNMRSSRQGEELLRRNTIFLYDDQTIQTVIPAFCRHVEVTINNLPEKVFKAVGSVGSEYVRGRKISDYWTEYRKSKKVINIKPTTLFQAVYHATQQKEGDAKVFYELIINALLELLRRANKKYRTPNGAERVFNKTSLFNMLNEGKKNLELNQFLTSWLTGKTPTQYIWGLQVNYLLQFFEISERTRSFLEDYIAYISPELNEPRVNAIDNIFHSDNGIDVEVTTIHGVKGETHAATLVMETKFDKYFDITCLLEYFVNDDIERPIESFDSPGKKGHVLATFMKKLFVAMSRPRYLVCLSVQKSSMTEQLAAALTEKGWVIRDLTHT